MTPFDRMKQAEPELVESHSVLRGRTRSGKPCTWTVRTEWEGLRQVVYDELAQGNGDMVSYYPVRPHGMTESIPIAISTRTHPHGKEGRYALGVFRGCYTNPNRQPTELYVIHFTDGDFARDAAAKASAELGHEFRSVVAERTPGRRRYSVLE